MPSRDISHSPPHRDLSSRLPCFLADWPLWLLFSAIVWVMIGAPVTAEEIAELPHTFAMRIRQIPWRMGQILRLWLPL